MKKLLGIVVLGLLLSGNAYAGWFDKDIILVTKCYAYPDFKNYKEHRKYNLKHGMTRYEWEINLKEKIAYKIVEMNGQLHIDQYKIKIKTKSYIVAHDPKGDFRFDLKNEAIIIKSIIGTETFATQLNCKFS